MTTAPKATPRPAPAPPKPTSWETYLAEQTVRKHGTLSNAKE